MDGRVGESMQDRRVLIDRRQQPRRRNAVSSQSAAAVRAAQPLEPRRAGRAGPEPMLPLTKFRQRPRRAGSDRLLPHGRVLAPGRGSCCRGPDREAEAQYATRPSAGLGALRGEDVPMHHEDQRLSVAGEKTGASVRSGRAGSTTRTGSRSAGPRSGPISEPRHECAPDGSATRLSRVTRPRATPSS